jgi:hypothetical protein
MVAQWIQFLPYLSMNRQRETILSIRQLWASWYFSPDSQLQSSGDKEVMTIQTWMWGATLFWNSYSYAPHAFLILLIFHSWQCYSWGHQPCLGDQRIRSGLSYWLQLLVNNSCWQQPLHLFTSCYIAGNILVMWPVFFNLS